MSSDAFFSVVIPLYNKEKTIQRALLSVLTQTHPYFELIVVDDGSTDSSVTVAGQIQDDRIRIARQGNQGVSAARNHGISQAVHPFVAFLDADDEWKPDFLQQIHDLMVAFPEAVLYGAGYEIVNTKGEVSQPALDMFPPGWRGELPNYLRTLSSKYLFNSSSVVVKRLTLQAVGGFPVGISFGEDLVTWIKCSFTGRVVYVNLPLSIYHQELTDSAIRTFDRRQEIYPVKFLKTMLAENTIPEDSRTFALDFIAKAAYKQSESHFQAGEPLRGILALRYCLPSRVYRQKIILLLRKRLLPAIKKKLVG